MRVRSNYGVVGNAQTVINTSTKVVASATDAQLLTSTGNWLSVPGAPTIGTANPTLSQTVSVTFTAPANGGSAITSYIVTSTPGNITATGSSSPISVTGLTDGVSYTFTVKAVNAVGTGNESAASNSATPNNVTADILVVAGGAAGSGNGGTSGGTTRGGGGGGGVQYSLTTGLSASTTYTITVGNGGTS